MNGWLLLLLSVVVVQAAPGAPVAPVAGRGAWGDWVVGGDDADTGASILLRRITPKSVFVAPTFTGCSEGYKQDSLGRCVKLVKVNPQSQWNFFLERLNSMYAPTSSSSKPHKEAGPFHINLPLGSDEPQESVVQKRIPPPPPPQESVVQKKIPPPPPPQVKPPVPTQPTTTTTTTKTTTTTTTTLPPPTTTMSEPTTTETPSSTVVDPAEVTSTEKDVTTDTTAESRRETTTEDVNVAVMLGDQPFVEPAVESSKQQFVDQAVESSDQPFEGQTVESSNRPFVDQAVESSDQPFMGQAVESSDQPFAGQTVESSDQPFAGQTVESSDRPFAGQTVESSNQPFVDQAVDLPKSHQQPDKPFLIIVTNPPVTRDETTTFTPDETTTEATTEETSKLEEVSSDSTETSIRPCGDCDPVDSVVSLGSSSLPEVDLVDPSSQVRFPPQKTQSYVRFPESEERPPFWWPSWQIRRHPGIHGWPESDRVHGSTDGIRREYPYGATWSTVAWQRRFLQRD